MQSELELDKLRELYDNQLIDLQIEDDDMNTINYVSTYEDEEDRTDDDYYEQEGGK